MFKNKLRLFFLGLSLLCFGLHGWQSRPQLADTAAKKLFVEQAQELSTLRLDFYGALAPLIPRTEFFATAMEATDISRENDFPPLNQRVWELLYERREQLSTCNREHDFYLFEWNTNVYEFNVQYYLIEQFCGSSYNRQMQYFLYDPVQNPPQIIPLVFESMQEDESGRWHKVPRSVIAGVRTYDPEQKLLKLFGRGIAQSSCGVFAQYQWHEREQRFVLLEYRSQPICHVLSLDPPDYPLVYQRPED